MFQFDRSGWVMMDNIPFCFVKSYAMLDEEKRSKGFFLLTHVTQNTIKEIKN
jgi:hypothetical protein